MKISKLNYKHKSAELSLLRYKAYSVKQTIVKKRLELKVLECQMKEIYRSRMKIGSYNALATINAIRKGLPVAAKAAIKPAKLAVKKPRTIKKVVTTSNE